MNSAHPSKRRRREEDDEGDVQHEEAKGKSAAADEEEDDDDVIRPTPRRDTRPEDDREFDEMVMPEDITRIFDSARIADLNRFNDVRGVSRAPDGVDLHDDYEYVISFKSPAEIKEIVAMCQRGLKASRKGEGTTLRWTVVQFQNCPNFSIDMMLMGNSVAMSHRARVDVRIHPKFAHESFPWVSVNPRMLCKKLELVRNYEMLRWIKIRGKDDAICQVTRCADGIGPGRVTWISIVADREMPDVVSVPDTVHMYTITVKNHILQAQCRRSTSKLRTITFKIFSEHDRMLHEMRDGDTNVMTFAIQTLDEDEKPDTYWRTMLVRVIHSVESGTPTFTMEEVKTNTDQIMRDIDGGKTPAFKQTFYVDFIEAFVSKIDPNRDITLRLGKSGIDETLTLTYRHGSYVVSQVIVAPMGEEDAEE